MVLKYHLSPYPTLLEDMVVRIWESDNDLPGQEVYTEVIPEDGGGGHPNIHTVIASGLDLRPHRIRLYGVTSNNLLHFYEAEPRVDAITIFDPIRFKIGDGQALTPAAGNNAYTNPILDGLTQEEFIIIRNNVGALHPVTHYTWDDPSDTWQLTGADVFNINEEYTIMLPAKKVTSVVNDSVVGKWFGGFINITAPTVWGATHLRKLLRFKATTTYSFNSPPPIGYGIAFQNFGPGVGQVGTVNFVHAPLLWNAGTVSTILLPLRSEMMVVWDGTNYNVVYMSDVVALGTTTPQPGQTLGVGTVFFGDVANGDTQTILNHNLNITGDYLVFFSRRAGGAASAPRDNDVQISWWHHTSAPLKADSFLLSLGDPFNVAPAQNLTLCWLIIKL